MGSSRNAACAEIRDGTPITSAARARKTLKGTASSVCPHTVSASGSPASAPQARQGCGAGRGMPRRKATRSNALAHRLRPHTAPPLSPVRHSTRGRDDVYPLKKRFAICNLAPVAIDYKKLSAHTAEADLKPLYFAQIVCKPTK